MVKDQGFLFINRGQQSVQVLVDPDMFENRYPPTDQGGKNGDNGDHDSQDCCQGIGFLLRLVFHKSATLLTQRAEMIEPEWRQYSTEGWPQKRRNRVR